MKRVICKSGIKGWQARLHKVYKTFGEWSAFAEIHGLHTRLGYQSPLEAWKDNPVIQGSVNHSDFCKVN